MYHKLEKLLRANGYPRKNPYIFSEMEKEFAEHNIILTKSAFDIAVDFDGIVASFGQEHRNIRFDIQFFPGQYNIYTVENTSNIVGKELIPFAYDDGDHVWLVSEDGNIYTDWSDVIYLQGHNIFTALAGAIDDDEGIEIKY